MRNHRHGYRTVTHITPVNCRRGRGRYTIPAGPTRTRDTDSLADALWLLATFSLYFWTAAGVMLLRTALM